MWQIIVCERGWIFVGKTRREGDQIVIEPSWNVRRFSIAKKDGLGGLAKRGPLKDNDILDEIGKNSTHVIGVITSIDCDQERWNKWARSR
jgi:hypothetical protein